MIEKMLCVRTFIIIPLLWVLNVHAELTVIYDSGHTFPVSKYLKQERINHKPPLNEIKNNPIMPSIQYPIVSHALSPGKVTPRTLKLPAYFRPLFIIGSDPLSKQWLTDNITRLTELNAVGILTQADDENDLNTLQSAFPGLVIMPMSADVIAEQVNIKHYPVLITGNAVQQ